MQTEIKHIWLRVSIWRQFVCMRVYFHSACARVSAFSALVTWSPWHRLRMRLDIGFAFALTSASHYYDIGVAFPLTSASHSLWHRLRILLDIPVNLAKARGGFPPRTFPKQNLVEEFTLFGNCTEIVYRVIRKSYQYYIQNHSKFCPKNFQKLLKLPQNLFPNPFLHDMQSNMKNISKISLKNLPKPLQNLSKHLFKTNIKIIKQ